MGAAELARWTPATDTQEIPRVQRGTPVADLLTMELSILDLPPRPDEAPPVPQRLPKRLRRRGLAHVAAAWRAATLTRAALATSAAGLALSGCGAL
jgi:hypothetical protein